MTFEGAQLRGAAKIAEKLQTLTFQKINRVITVIDSQPTFDGGVLISVLGRLQVSIRPFFWPFIDLLTYCAVYKTFSPSSRWIPFTSILNDGFYSIWFCGRLFVGGARILWHLQTDDDLPHAFVQSFCLKPIGTSFFILHDIFRLVLHDQA